MAKKLSTIEIKLLQRAINDTNMQLGEKREDIVHKASVILDYCQNPNKKEVCAKYDITPRTVQRWIEKFQLAGSEGKSEQEILLMLSDKPFKKSCYITEAEINQIIPDFSKNPIEYDLCYSVWDEFIVKEFLTKYHPSVSSSPESIKKIIQACRIKYKNDFFDHNYTKVETYKSLLDDQSATYLYCHVYYLGSKLYDKYNFGKNLVMPLSNSFFEYYYGVFMPATDKTRYDSVAVTSQKKFPYFKWYQKFFDKITFNTNQKYIIVTANHKSERLAIQELYKSELIKGNIQFLTIPIPIYRELDNEYFDKIWK